MILISVWKRSLNPLDKSQNISSISQLVCRYSSQLLQIADFFLDSHRKNISARALELAQLQNALESREDLKGYNFNSIVVVKEILEKQD